MPEPQTLDAIASRRRFRRKIEGIAAALLPYEAEGKIAVEAFQQNLQATHQAGLKNAVNMDTGYVNYLRREEKLHVLRWTREALGAGVTFVAGAYVEREEGDLVTLYRREMDSIVEAGGIPILFQSARLHGVSSAEKAANYGKICRGYDQVLAFELGKMFAPNGEIFEAETFRRLMEIPEIKGMKHSSLNRQLELERLELRDLHRPEFRIYTGNDLGIDMVEYGSDYLLGLAAFAPEKFAARDCFWETGNPEYFALNDALQYLGNVAFREPVPAYKHSAAIFLKMVGRIPTDRTHPANPQRPAWEEEILRDCARRLGYNRDPFPHHLLRNVVSNENPPF
jgi:4-hydroxy-tetrahydrodipicolinate synthase